MSLLRDLKNAGITAQDIIAAVKTFQSGSASAPGYKPKIYGLGFVEVNGVGIAYSAPVPEQPFRRPVWVKIVSARSPEGLYRCIMGRPLGLGGVANGFNPDTDGADYEFDDYDYLKAPATYNAYFVNQAEEGKDEQWLDPGGHYFGFMEGTVAADGLPLIRGHTFDTQLCTEE